MMRRIFLPTVAAVSLWLSSDSSRALAQGKAKAGGWGKKAEEMMAAPAADVKWGELKVPGFDPGAQMAVMDGNPGAAGGVYTLRLKFPAGYHFPSHWHPNAEHLTVLSGSLTLAMGTSEDRSAEKTYGPGDFLMLPGRHPHYGGASAETVVQLHGVGPFKIVLAKKAGKSTGN